MIWTADADGRTWRSEHATIVQRLDGTYRYDTQVRPGRFVGYWTGDLEQAKAESERDYERWGVKEQ